MMVHLTKEKSEVSWGVRGACFYTKNFLSPKTREFLSPGSASHTLMFWESQNPELIRAGSRDPRT